jgi:hypothetical protein
VFKDQWNGLIAIVTNVGNAINNVCGGALDALITKAQQFAGMLQSMVGMGGGGSVGGGGGVFTDADVEKLFSGGSDSIIAKVVGMAEGNRTADGGYTQHAKGHIDPGNGAHNIGSFSAQGNLNDGTIEGSDARVMNTLLKPQISKLMAAANQAGVQVTSKVLFNYIDLLNQAPDAATGWANGKGFLGGLSSLKGKENDDGAIRNLRAEGFRNNSGNLETTFSSKGDLERDQQRRMDEINKAISAFQSSLPSGAIGGGIASVANLGLSASVSPTAAKITAEAQKWINKEFAPGV